MIVLLYIIFVLFIIAAIFSILSIIKDAHIYAHITKAAIAIILLCLFVEGFFVSQLISAVYTIHIFTFFYLITTFLTLLLIYMGVSRWKEDFRSLSAIILPITAVIVGISIFFYDSSRQMTIDPQHGLMIVHIILALLGEVMFFLAFASSALYVFVSWHLQKKTSMRYINKLPSLTILSRLKNFSLSRSLLFFSAGIMFGIIMLFELHGNISLGSPKEILMYAAWGVLFILWLIGKSHLTNNYYHSISTIISFVILMGVFIATNVVITTGFHSFR